MLVNLKPLLPYRWAVFFPSKHWTTVALLMTGFDCSVQCIQIYFKLNLFPLHIVWGENYCIFSKRLGLIWDVSLHTTSFLSNYETTLHFSWEWYKGSSCNDLVKIAYSWFPLNRECSQSYIPCAHWALRFSQNCHILTRSFGRAHTGAETKYYRAYASCHLYARCISEIEMCKFRHKPLKGDDSCFCRRSHRIL